jgi:hypothetical protein
MPVIHTTAGNNEVEDEDDGVGHTDGHNINIDESDDEYEDDDAFVPVAPVAPSAVMQQNVVMPVGLSTPGMAGET